MGKIKLTKSTLNKIIHWTSTRYNDWLGYGTKKQNVEFAFKVLVQGDRIETIECASPVGENPHRGTKKYWKISQSGSKYIINGIEKSVTVVYSKEVIYFI